VTVFLQIVAVLLIVVGNAFFVTAEYSLVTARRSRLSELAEAGSRRARYAVKLIDDPVRFIATSQLGVTFFSILLGAVGEPLVADFFDPLLATTVALILGFAIITYLHVTLGELVPKALALSHRETIALWVSVPLELFRLATYPVVSLLQWSTNLFNRAFSISPAAAGVITADEAEIRMMVATAEDTGAIEEHEEEMLYKVFDFADKEVHEVMVPRPEVVALSIELPSHEALAAVIDSPYTRYPVYRGSLDEVLGVLHVRDLFSALYSEGMENVDIGALVRPAFMVPETKDLAAMLAEFRRTNQHMAIVVDEYGSFEGLVTLEDLLEEIVGEIEDEYDLPDESVERIDDNRIRIDGTFPIDDFNERFAQELPQDDYHTVAGFVFGALGRAAEAGDEVLHDGLRFQVVDVDGPRIERLEIEFLESEPEKEEVTAE
jgi:magnesium and cobalt exporter, CNNM family